MRTKRLLVGLSLIVAVIVALRVFHVDDLVHIGAGYTAEQTCACLFVSGRSLESCRGDLDPMARWLVSLTPGHDEVTTRSLVIAHATARYEKGFGCTLKN